MKPKLHRVRICEINIHGYDPPNWKGFDFHLDASIPRIKWRRIITDALLDKGLPANYILIDRVSMEPGKVWSVKQVLKAIQNYEL